MPRSVLRPCRVTVWLLLIFTPLAWTGAESPPVGPAPHDGDERRIINVWVRLIEHTGCREVLLLDHFEFLRAHRRPTFGRQLFTRLAAAGLRVSVRRQVGRSSHPAPPPLHRLAIVVPIVPSVPPSVPAADNGTLGGFFKQIGRESAFLECYSWLFVVEQGLEGAVRHALWQLPIRADSSVTLVVMRDASSGPGGGWEIPPFSVVRRSSSIVPRMQTRIHPEVASRTVVELRLPADQQWNGSKSASKHCSCCWCCVVSVEQLYRLQTRTNTIDVAIDLLGVEHGGGKTQRTTGLVLYRAREVEQRNDFFARATLTIRVHSSGAEFVNSTLVAESMPLFRNARIVHLQTNQAANNGRGNGWRPVDFNFRLMMVYCLSKRAHNMNAYSVPLFHDRLFLYIRYADISYEERSVQILVVVLLPVAAMGALFSLSLQLMFNRTVGRTAGETTAPPLTPVDCVLWFIGVFAQQGSLVRPNSLATMVLVLVALLFSLIMYCTYLTRIASQLSVHVEEHDYLDDLLETNDYQIGYVGNFTKDQTFYGGNFDPAMAEVLRRMEKDKTLFVFSYEEGIERVLASKYGLIGSAGMVRQTIERLDDEERCKITELTLAEIDQSMVLQLESNYAYRKMVNYEILRTLSNGIAARLTTQMIARNKCCLKYRKFQNITIRHIRLQLLLILFGTTLAALVLGLELIVFYSKKFRALLKHQDNARRVDDRSNRSNKTMVNI